MSKGDKEMLTAREARALTWSKSHKAEVDQFHNISDLIERTANKGEYSFIFKYELFPKVYNTLRENEYDVVQDELTRNYIISWR